MKRSFRSSKNPDYYGGGYCKLRMIIPFISLFRRNYRVPTKRSCNFSILSRHLKTSQLSSRKSERFGKSVARSASAALFAQRPIVLPAAACLCVAADLAHHWFGRGKTLNREPDANLRNGMKPVSVERLHSKKYLNGVCDAGSKEVPHGTSCGSASRSCHRQSQLELNAD